MVGFCSFTPLLPSVGTDFQEGGNAYESHRLFFQPPKGECSIVKVE